MEQKVRKRRLFVYFFTEGFIKGLGTAFGATVGFAVVVSIIGFIINQLGGLPWVGGSLANLVHAILINLNLDKLPIE